MPPNRPFRINLFNRQPPFYEFHGDHHRIYTIYNKDATSGSYYHIHNNGCVDLVTYLNHQPTDIVRIKEAGI